MMKHHATIINQRCASKDPHETSPDEGNFISSPIDWSSGWSLFYLFIMAPLPCFRYRIIIIIVVSDFLQCVYVIQFCCSSKRSLILCSTVLADKPGLYLLLTRKSFIYMYVLFHLLCSLLSVIIILKLICQQTMCNWLLLHACVYVVCQSFSFTLHLSFLFQNNRPCYCNRCPSPSLPARSFFPCSTSHSRA